MEGFNLKNLIPVGLIFPFLLIIALEIGISYGLNFYNQRLNQKTLNLESSLTKKEEEIVGTLEKNEAFFVFSQVVNITEILKNRKSLVFIIQKFKQIMPKFFNIKEFKYNAEKNEISFEGTVLNFQDYARIVRYLISRPEFEIRDVKFPRILENNLFEFSITLFLKSEFFR